MQVLAAGAVCAIASEGKVDAGFGFVVGREVGFGAYFVCGVCEGALSGWKGTLSRKGQNPFSIQYLQI